MDFTKEFDKLIMTHFIVFIFFTHLALLKVPTRKIQDF